MSNDLIADCQIPFSTFAVVVTSPAFGMTMVDCASLAAHVSTASISGSQLLAALRSMLLEMRGSCGPGI
jgi:hypothetical protein